MERVISENILRLRKARGFRTQEAFAEAAGIPFRTYQDIERGMNWPQRRNLDAIAKALRVEPVELFQVGTNGDSRFSIAADIFRYFSALNEDELDALRGWAKAFANKDFAAIRDAIQGLSDLTKRIQQP